MNQPTMNKQDNNNNKQYKIQNQKDFTYLNDVQFMRQSKAEILKHNTYHKFVNNSSNLMKKWFKLMSSDYVLVEFDQLTKKIKFYEDHEKFSLNFTYKQKQVSANIKINNLTKWNDQLLVELSKNLLNKAISTNFKYRLNNYQSEYDPQMGNIIKSYPVFGVKFDHGKMLTKSLFTNEKKIYFDYHPFIKNNPYYFQQLKLGFYLSNRQNFLYKQSNQNQYLLGERVVGKNSDMIGLKLVSYYTNLGLKLKFQTAYDHFNQSYFQKFYFNLGNFKEYENQVFEYKFNGGIVMGRNLQKNDLFTRFRNRWVDDKSKSYLQSRVNIIIKNFHPILGGFLQILPFFYLQATISNNLQQIKTKYELDYGVGIRLLNLNASLETSLLRMGKNLDEINPSIRIVF